MGSIAIPNALSEALSAPAVRQEKEEWILVFRTGHLGDALVSIPAVRAIREAHPESRLLLLTDRSGPNMVSCWEVFGPTGFFAGVCFLPEEKKMRGWPQLVRTLRRHHPRTLYYLSQMPRSRRQIVRDWIFFALLCGLRQKVGLRPTGPYPLRQGGGTLVKMEKESERLFHWIAASLPGRGRRDPPARNGITPPAPACARVAVLLNDGGRAGRSLVAIGPGGNRSTQRWPERYFASLGEALLQRFPEVELVVLGGPGERPLGERLCRSWGQRARNFAGFLSVWESAALLRFCRLYIGNDTGTMHLAAAAGTPCVAVFSARENPGRWEPAGEGHTVLRREVACAGCCRESCGGQDYLCLKSILPAEVLASAFPYLTSPLDMNREDGHG